MSTTRTRATIRHTEVVEAVVESQAKLLSWRRTLGPAQQAEAEQAARLIRRACQQLEAMERGKDAA